MLTYAIDRDGTLPMYRKLYELIKTDILRGNLAAGQKLPSRRALAGNLGLGVSTVENAYSLLEDEGYICSQPQRGFFVADITAAVSHTAGARTSVPPKHPSSAAQNLYADFSANRTSADDFPFSVWAKIVRTVLSENRDELMTPSPAAGTLELRTAIAEHLCAFRGMNVDPSCIVVGAGTEYLYGLLIQLLGFEKKYALENPGYSKIQKIYSSYGVCCKTLDMDESGIKIDALKETGTEVVHVSPSHHFPLGLVMPVSRRYELLSWSSQQNGRYIVEDDYDGEFRFTGKPLPTLKSIDALGNVIYMNTFTKTLASTIRISYMVLPPQLMEEFNRRLGFYSCTVPTFEQYALARFMKGGFFEKHINRMRKAYRTKRDLLIEGLEKNSLHGGIKILEENAGLHFLVRFDLICTDQEFRQKLLEHGIKMEPLSSYYENPPAAAEHYFVISYSSVPCERIAGCAELIAKTFTQCRRT